MASDLILRLCQVNPEDGGLPHNQHIALNDFTDGLYDILGGYHTPLQMKTFYDMPADQQADLDVLLGKIDSAATIVEKLGRIHRFRSILTKWERREDLNLTGYDTPDDIETQLLNIDQGFV
jgi:hypothetical protein